MVWIIGEYAERIDNADELLESFLEVQTLLACIIFMGTHIPHAKACTFSRRCLEHLQHAGYGEITLSQRNVLVNMFGNTELVLNIIRAMCEIRCLAVQAFPEENAAVQLQLVTAAVKLFLKSPQPRAQQMIQLVLTYATQVHCLSAAAQSSWFVYWGSWLCLFDRAPQTPLPKPSTAAPLPCPSCTGSNSAELPQRNRGINPPSIVCTLHPSGHPAHLAGERWLMNVPRLIKCVHATGDRQPGLEG